MTLLLYSFTLLLLPTSARIASETGTPYAAACTVYAALCGCDWMLLGCSPLRIWGARNRHLLESKRLGGDPPGCRGSYFYTHCLFHSCAMMQEVRALHDYRASERIARSGHSGGFS